MARNSLEDLWSELKLGQDDVMSIHQYSQVLSVLCPSAVWNNQKQLDRNEFIESLQSVLEALHPFMTVEDRMRWLATHFRVDINGKLSVLSENIPSKQSATVRTTNLAQLQASSDVQVLKAKQRQKIASINQLANPRELVRKLNQPEPSMDNCTLRAIGSKAYDKDLIQSSQDPLEKN